MSRWCGATANLLSNKQDAIMNIQEYILEIQRQFATGVAREHTYRPALQQLLATMLPHLTVSNEPARQACGAPDYILQRKEDNIPIAFIEAKDIGDSDLGGRNKHKEQFQRYRASLDNIIFTDYLDFWLYENGDFVDSVCIAKLNGEKITPLKENFEKFESIIKHFGNAKPQHITSPAKLAHIMAGKARLLADVIERTLAQGDGESNLEGQMAAFKEVLIHDITDKEFADVYAQTIAYGMFAARLHDDSMETFSRHEAATLIPKTNPFLRKLFQDIAGFDLDERICWIVDDLAETFRATDMQEVMQGFGQRTQQTDPVIHFYEDFLSAYDPKLRKSRGVWYTPQAIVNFIVRAVDALLQAEFGLPMGLADTSKIAVEQSVIQSKDNRYSDNKKKTKAWFHKVQILDPATGTGTFLAETVSQIYKKFNGQAGMWQGYVEEHLLPRLNGFELLIASYTMAHLKLDLLLTDTGYKSVKDARLRVFLTNSLEEYHKDTGTLFSQFLAREANGANGIKRDTPVMVVLGNPPYSGISSNNGEWITRLIDDYKYVNGKGINERKHWLNDDYVKFIRLGQYYVDRNDEGILAYINNHSFIDNPTFRGMRWNLLHSFDKIYIIDLHGNSKKKETAPDGSKDENVFDIQQGVSINIFVKTGRKAKGALAEVYHADVYGRRQAKYDYLLANDIRSIAFEKVTPTAPFYFLMPKDETGREEYSRGFSINELMPVSVTGVVTARDSLVIDTNKEALISRIKHFSDDEYSDDEIRKEFFPNKKQGKYLAGDSRGWSLSKARIIIKNFNHEEKVQSILYRPFDAQYIYYTSEMVDWGREKIFCNFIETDNIGLVIARQAITNNWSHVLATKDIVDNRIFYSNKGISICCPLYIYDQQSERTPNIDTDIVKKIAKAAHLEFEAERSGDKDKFAPIDLIDYIYAILHSPAYREKYNEFLKVDFPRVPYPKGAEQFRRMSAIGSELRRIHLMEHPALSELITQYPITGNNTVEKIRWELLPDGGTGRIWINAEQYFDNVPITAWEFYIGGYQPAQKWLKDRIGKMLSYDNIMHYQRIIKVLIMTDALMAEIDKS